LRSGVDCFIAIDDDRSREAMRELASAGVASGESGAAGLAALLELFGHPDADTFRQRLGIGDTTRVLVISTEGATDPASYERIVGRPPAVVASDSR
jgi:diaminopropionate ammonia-lyase